MKQYLKLLRVKHYIKNLLIFLPAVAAHKLFNFQILGELTLGFVQFCLLSSAVYVFNDLHDVEGDRAHPAKCKRPLANGAISAGTAKALFGALLIAVAAISAVTFNPRGALVLAVYFAVNAAYSMRLKHVVLVDIVILVSGYILRILFSLAITGISNSKWLFLTILFASLFLAFGKRRGELKKQGDNITRPVLSKYPPAYLDKCMYMTETLAIMFYSLWSFIILPETNNMVYTVPLLVALLLRYNLCLEQDFDGDPVTTLFGDRVTLLLCLAFCGLFVWLLYV